METKEKSVLPMRVITMKKFRQKQKSLKISSLLHQLLMKAKIQIRPMQENSKELGTIHGVELQMEVPVDS